MSDKAPETPDEEPPDSPGTPPPPSDPTATPPPADPTAASPQAPPPVPGHQPPSPWQQPPAAPGDQQPGSQPPVGPPPYGQPGYGPPQQPPGYYQVPPGHDPWQAYGAPHQGAPGYDPSAYGAAGYGPPGYGPAGPGYQLPPGYYAGPEDPLVSANFGGWWQRSFTLLAAVWRPMVQVQLLWAIPLAIVGVLSALYVPEQVGFSGTTAPDLSEVFTPLLLLLPFTLLAVVLTLVAQLATLEVVVQRATGRPVSAGQALLAGLRRSLALLGWQILAGLTVLAGALLCFLPGIYAAIVLIILPPIILLERGKGIGRAFQLFHADFGASIARIATVGGLNIAFILVEGVFVGVLNPGADTSSPLGIASAVLSALFSVATGVVICPLILTAYADMRARHEPFSTAYLAAD
ncbi:hypothetical protein [Paractinoplanes maris]|uniref:hypothetical protein n=1 Tax=Paractinoplanes maris TaxID=1734446 RepID=UPI0020225A3C|nr:hypothetical protein [Actinoplanes maris]